MRPSDESRVSVWVVLRDRMSTSPEDRASKRSFAVRPKKRTLEASPKIGGRDAVANVCINSAHLSAVVRG